MGKLRLSGRNNITSPNGNSLAIFVDGLNGQLQLKDVMGNIEPLSNYTGCVSPFQYDSNATGIEPILGSNNASGQYATIGGGICNTASGICSTIGGGVRNNVSNAYSTISGGIDNTATAYFSTIGGGQSNIACGDCSTIGGGVSNTTSCFHSTIGGGNLNIASGRYSTIGGGQANGVSGNLGFIGGGKCNFIGCGCCSSILAGAYNDTCNQYNVHILGSNLCATQSNTTFTNCISAQNLTAGCFIVVAPNGVLTNSPTIPYSGSIMQIGAGTGSTERCGLANNAQGNYSVVTGGKFNCAFGNFSTISGGICNCTYSDFDIIAGGQHNVTCANQSIIGGGSYNTTNGNDSTIAGGKQNSTFGCYSIIGGGYKNSAGADNSIVGGGSCNIANFEHSFVGGGYCNVAGAIHSIVVGGQNNTASGGFSTIGGGCSNTASGQDSTIGGGKSNISSCYSSFVGGGRNNDSQNIYTTISGGRYNTASGGCSTIGGGYTNTASGDNSSILGGQYNNTCNFSNAMIVGSNLCATQGCTTFMNCASANNLTVGCLVSVGTNKVLENSFLNVSTINTGLFAQTTDSTPVTATSIESSLIGVGVGTLSVPANGFTIGNSFNAFFDGGISSINTATLIIRVKTLSGAILADTGVIDMATSTNKAWKLDLQFTIRTLGTTGVASISSGGTFSYVTNASDKFDGYVLSTINSTTFDTTVDNTLVVTAQWNTNNAGNSILSRNFVLTKVY